MHKNSIQTLALEFVDTRSEASLKKLINRLKPGLLGFVEKYVKDRDLSHEIVNQVFISVWEKCDQYNPKWNFSTWVYTIAKNESLGALRLKKRYLSHERLEENHSKLLKDNSPVVHMETEVMELTGHEALDSLYEKTLSEIYTLDEPYRSIMIEREINRNQLQFIANRLGMNLSTVKTRLRKARKMVEGNLLKNNPSLVMAYYEKE